MTTVANGLAIATRHDRGPFDFGSHVADGASKKFTVKEQLWGIFVGPKVEEALSVQKAYACNQLKEEITAQYRERYEGAVDEEDLGKVIESIKTFESSTDDLAQLVGKYQKTCEQKFRVTDYSEPGQGVEETATWMMVHAKHVPVNQAWTSLGRYQGRVKLVVSNAAYFDPKNQVVDAQGVLGSPEGLGTSYPMPANLKFGAILNDGSKNELRYVGKKFEKLYPEEVELKIGPNDSAQGLKDNSGYWTVVVYQLRK
ncbi:MAG: hypothetical protein R3B41_01655 [Candidatus Doudnabacteria bacterium]